MERRDVDVVLVRPARSANVGGACRALKNMGFGAPILVAPAGLDRGEAARVAWGAEDLVAAAREVGTLEDAVAGVQFVAATSGRAAETWTPRQLAAHLASRGGRAALVFGPEADGLGKGERRRADVVVRIPTADEQSSLNLAQAVLLLTWELRLALADAPPAPAAAAAAAPGELHAALGELAAALAAIGFVDPARPGSVLAELRHLLARAEPGAREIVLLRGLARQMRWAGEQARSERAR
ncbi:MAG: RNA methyltransferase [Vicinamibacteria bacterium]|nr:RNA methyltransferase [Vicinamibacteria bacterium]